MGRRRWRSLATAAPVIALVAASCGGGTGGGGDDAVTGGSSTPSIPTTTTAAPTTTAAVALADSFRGVTADTIHVGFTSIDFPRLNNDFGLELTYASFTPAMERMVEDLNARGGIHGRSIELHVRPFLPVGANEAEAICVDLTQDVGVFAVLLGFSGPGAQDVNECFTVLNDTILVGTGGSPEQLGRATAPWISNSMSGERRARGLVDLIDAEGRLGELGRIAILSSTEAEEATADTLTAAFEAKGVDVVQTTTVLSTGDQSATAAEVDVATERARSERVDTFVFLGDDAYANEQLILSADEFNLVWLNSDQVGHWRTDPPPGIENAKLILATGSGSSSRDDPEWADCVRLADEAYGTPILPADEREETATDYWSGMVNACLNLRLFELIATAAGPDLTNESFAAAVEGFGDYTMPSTPYASLGAGKYDGSDTLRLTAWDAEEGRWRAISEPYDVTP